ncbi:MAG TPA: ABC transporter ATP-binding protein [Polyangiaceae bacterium]|nr:ABC transporter ATP-binding protein [Polyangiaceae bacterium]
MSQGDRDSNPDVVRLPWPEVGPVVLKTRGLCRELGTDVKNRVLIDVDLEVRAREFVSITGFSGSGKSTLLYLLGALDRPTSGVVELDGVDISKLEDDARAHLRNEKLGFVFQFHFLLPEFTVLENVMIPMLRRADKSRRDIEQKARDVLASIGLGDLLGRRPHQLSGGQQQRVSIARAVANDPRIVLADEPTGNLDSKSGRNVMDVFERLVRDQGITVIMVTHEQTFAARTSRQLSMSDGRIVTDVDQRPKP